MLCYLGSHYSFAKSRPVPHVTQEEEDRTKKTYTPDTQIHSSLETDWTR